MDALEEHLKELQHIKLCINNLNVLKIDLGNKTVTPQATESQFSAMILKDFKEPSKPNKNLNQQRNKHKNVLNILFSIFILKSTDSNIFSTSLLYVKPLCHFSVIIC